MGKLKTIFMGFGVLCVLLLMAFVSPLRNELINHFYYNEGDYPYIAPVYAKEQLPSQLGSWFVDENGWRYTSDNGEEIANASVQIGGNEYLFNEEGYMAIGWDNYQDNWYYLSYAGRKETGWLDQEEGIYYLDKNGEMVYGWNRIDNKNYYFSEAGLLTSGWILQDDKYHYINEDGTPHTGWLKDNERHYYLDKDGAMQTGWIKDADTSYYLNANGTMVTGWQTIDDHSYYFNQNGAIHTGWLSDNGNTYYFDKSGVIATDWLKLGDYDYYMDPVSGAMHANGWIYDGKGAYYLDSEGIWISSKKVANGPTIALTFDDGPGQYTERLLTCLKENNATATFFVLGSLVDRYPNALKTMITNGCEIGNHSYSHTLLTSLDIVGVKKEIHDTNQRVKAITASDVLLVRPPGGAQNESIRNTVNAPFILWSVDTLDWQNRNTAIVIEKVLNSVKDGDIVLMHDIHLTSVEAAEVLIPALKEIGYNLVTVSELAAAKGKTLESKKVYSNF